MDSRRSHALNRVCRGRRLNRICIAVHSRSYGVSPTTASDHRPKPTPDEPAELVHLPGDAPFFTYQYGAGHVKMNGQVGWRGAPLAESLELLLTKFPHQRDITDIP